MTARAAARGAVVLVAALALVSGCGDPVAPAQSIYVTIETVPSPFGGGPIAASPRAVNFRFVGAQSEITASLSGSTLYTQVLAGDTVSVVVIAPVGQVLDGAVVKVRVPNAGQATSGDAVRLLQAAAADYSLVGALSYTMKIQALPPQ
ncbi:MAG: hypothetical protein ACHQU1_02385 [Gemmatimonadales bacterium]